MQKSRPLTKEDTSAAAPFAEDLLIEADAARDASSLAGDVVEAPSHEARARVLVRWRTPNGQLREERLAIVKGLEVEKGDVVLLSRPANWPEWVVTHVIEGAREPDTERGRRQLVMEAQDEVVLRCGEASITLRRNGRLVIRGAYVESRSRGTNRIKGGVVLIN